VVVNFVVLVEPATIVVGASLLRLYPRLRTRTVPLVVTAVVVEPVHLATPAADLVVLAAAILVLIVTGIVVVVVTTPEAVATRRVVAVPWGVVEVVRGRSVAAVERRRGMVKQVGPLPLLMAAAVEVHEVIGGVSGLVWQPGVLVGELLDEEQRRLALVRHEADRGRVHGVVQGHQVLESGTRPKQGR
jgi:hypothetical protein